MKIIIVLTTAIITLILLGISANIETKEGKKTISSSMLTLLASLGIEVIRIIVIAEVVLYMIGKGM